ncbi:MAG: ABC transporter permease [Bacteroidota bacterium]
MFKNYLKIGFRNLAKHRLYSFIHTIGLALGLAAFLLINQYTAFEKSYDQFHSQSAQLYRLTTDQILDGKIGVRDAMTWADAPAALQADLPEVIGSTTTFKRDRLALRKDGQPVRETNAIAADSNFLSLFDYQLLAGDAKGLSEPYTLVLTQTQAKKYFGQTDAVGQTIEVLRNFNRPFKVVGVIEDIPQNTHYGFDMILSLASYEEKIARDGWNNYAYYGYVKLTPDADLAKIEQQLPALCRKYTGEESKLVFNLQPIRDIHLHSDFTFEPEIHGSARAVYFLDIISIFILAIAWINYINLSTARATERAKEVGLRKVVGAQRRQLVGQFFTESLLINIFGAVLALLTAQFALPYFNDLVGKTILTQVWNASDLLYKLGFFCLLGTCITGIYPAFVLSSFQPIGVLKGAFTRTQKGAFLRKGLVVFQFTASLLLIAATTIVYQQIRYMTNVDLGIRTEKVIGFNNAFMPNLSNEEYESRYYSFLEEVKRQNGVAQVASISSLPGGGSSDIGATSGGVKIIGKTDRIEGVIYQNRMNDQLIPTLEIELVAGRNFDRNLRGDSVVAVVNQAFLKKLNIEDPNEVINEKLQFGHLPENLKFTIVGVIDDFNRSTLKSAIEPTVYAFRMVNSHTIARLDGQDLPAQIANIQAVWKQFYPNSPFSYAFLDERFEKLYKEDEKFGFIFANFAVLAVIVAIMGLFGLASFLSIQRTKEVCVRKVLGASTSNIILLFFKDFVWLILAAVLIGIPLTYVSMNDWLNGYAHRIDFPWWVILLSMFLVGLFAFLTVSFQTYKIARLNPAKTIKYE